MHKNLSGKCAYMHSACFGRLKGDIHRNYAQDILMDCVCVKLVTAQFYNCHQYHPLQTEDVQPTTKVKATGSAQPPSISKLL